MGVYIKGMEMPKSCWHCEFCRDGLDEYAQHYDYCVALDMNILISQTERHENCPLVEVPKHGRLIDADALIKLLDNCMFPSDMVTTRAVSMARNWLKESPTVIESEGE